MEKNGFLHIEFGFTPQQHKNLIGLQMALHAGKAAKALAVA